MLSGYHGDKGGAHSYCWDAALGNASNGGKNILPRFQLVENEVVILQSKLRDKDANGGRDLFIVKKGFNSYHFLMGVWISTAIGASKSLHSSRWKTTFTNC